MIDCVKNAFQEWGGDPVNLYKGMWKQKKGSVW